MRKAISASTCVAPRMSPVWPPIFSRAKAPKARAASPAKAIPRERGLHADQYRQWRQEQHRQSCPESNGTSIRLAKPCGEAVRPGIGQRAPEGASWQGGSGHRYPVRRRRPPPGGRTARHRRWRGSTLQESVLAPPKVPMRLSFMMSSRFFDRGWPPTRPSALSARPSSCRAPVGTTSAATTMRPTRRSGRPAASTARPISAAGSAIRKPASGTIAAACGRAGRAPVSSSRPSCGTGRREKKRSEAPSRSAKTVEEFVGKHSSFVGRRASHV